MDKIAPEHAQYVKDRYREAAEKGLNCTVKVTEQGLKVTTKSPTVKQQMAAVRKQYRRSLKKKTPD